MASRAPARPPCDESSGNSNSDMPLDVNDSEDVIEHVFDPAHFMRLAPDAGFVNEGLDAWAQQRAHWTRHSSDAGGAGAGGADDEDEDLQNLDIEHVMVCLQQGKPFPQLVSLAAAIEVLTVLWDEEGY